MDGTQGVTGDAIDVRKLSREKFESLCLLYVVEKGAYSAKAVAAELGLAADHEASVLQALSRLACIGCLEVCGDRVALAQGGRDWLRRLQE